MSKMQRTPLHAAGDSDICCQLLKAGAAVDVLDRWAGHIASCGCMVLTMDAASRCGRTPLHLASGEPKVRILCMYGAKINRLDPEGRTALDIALSTDRPLVWCCLVRFSKRKVKVFPFLRLPKNYCDLALSHPRN
jgi:hypothetical protein